MDETGTDLLLVSAHVGARPLCALDQGKVLSRSGATRSVKDGNGNSVRVDDRRKST